MDLRSTLGVQTRGGLIVEQEHRIHGQGAGHREALGHAAGEALSALRKEGCGGGQPHGGKHSLGNVADGLLVQAAGLAQHVDRHLDFVVELRVLWEEIRAALPELPDQKRLRFESEYGLSAHDARLLSASRALADFFEVAARAHGTAKSVANWMLRDLLAALREREIEIEEAAIAPEALARLIEMVDQGRVTAKSARDLVAELTEQGGDPEALVRERGLEAVSDAGLLESVADEVIGANPDAASRYARGDKKVVNFLMGQVMKKTQGKADPGQVREILARKLEE